MSLIFLEAPEQAQSSETLYLIYALSLLFLAVAMALIGSTIKIRKRVRTQYAADMAILDDWNSAIRAAYSGDESDILIALDKIWALSTPITYGEVQPVVSLFLHHTNPNISVRAQKILDKQLAIITKSPES